MSSTKPECVQVLLHFPFYRFHKQHHIYTNPYVLTGLYAHLRYRIYSISQIGLGLPNLIL